MLFIHGSWVEKYNNLCSGVVVVSDGEVLTKDMIFWNDTTVVLSLFGWFVWCFPLFGSALDFIFGTRQYMVSQQWCLTAIKSYLIWYQY